MVNPHSSTYCMVLYYHYPKKQYIHIISQSNPITNNKCQHWFYWYIGISTNTCPIFCWWPGAPPWSTAQTWSHKVWVWWYSKWVYGKMLEMALGLFILIDSRFPGAFLRRRFPPQFQPLTVAQWDSLSRWLVPDIQWTPVVWHQSKQWATTRRAP